MALDGLRLAHRDAREAGLRVPEGIAVVGHDSWDTMAMPSRPPLTTVDMDLTELGRVAALRLLDAIDGRPTAGRTGSPADWWYATPPDEPSCLRRPAAGGGDGLRSAGGSEGVTRTP